MVLCSSEYLIMDCSLINKENKRNNWITFHKVTQIHFPTDLSLCPGLLDQHISSLAVHFLCLFRVCVSLLSPLVNIHSTLGLPSPAVILPKAITALQFRRKCSCTKWSHRAWVYEKKDFFKRPSFTS